MRLISPPPTEPNSAAKLLVWMAVSCMVSTLAPTPAWTELIWLVPSIPSIWVRCVPLGAPFTRIPKINPAAWRGRAGYQRHFRLVEAHALAGGIRAADAQQPEEPHTQRLHRG